MTPALLTTVGLAGAYMAIVINLVIVFGQHQYDKVEVGTTMALVVFALMLLVAALECRDQEATVLRTETFDNKSLNIALLVEIALAIMITQADFLRSLLGTAMLTSEQWLIGAAPAVALLVLWELGKWIARARSGRRDPEQQRSGTDTVATAA